MPGLFNLALRARKTVEIDEVKFGYCKCNISQTINRQWIFETIDHCLYNCFSVSMDHWALVFPIAYTDKWILLSTVIIKDYRNTQLP